MCVCVRGPRAGGWVREQEGGRPLHACQLHRHCVGQGMAQQLPSEGLVGRRRAGGNRKAATNLNSPALHFRLSSPVPRPPLALPPTPSSQPPSPQVQGQHPAATHSPTRPYALRYRERTSAACCSAVLRSGLRSFLLASKGASNWACMA